MHRVRRLVVGAVVLAGLLVVTDRVALTVAEQAVADELQAAAELDERPSVHIGGFPFLTQAIGGTYGDVHVEAAAVPTGGVPVARFVADLTDLEVALGDALSGSVQSAPVGALEARAVVSYADLARQSRLRGLTVGRSGDRVVVRGSLRVLGATVQASTVSSVRLQGGSIVVRAEELRVGAGVASSEVRAAIGTQLDLRVRVGTLPYGLVLTGASVGDEGIVLTARATDTVLTAR